MSRDGEQSFLARWAKRKAEARAGDDPDSRLEAPQGHAVPTGDGEPALTQDEIDAIVAELPRIEDLTPGSSIAQFLQRGVPIHLQRAAMRRIWSIDPGIRDFIEVAENQYDWNAVGGCPGFEPLDPAGDHSALVKAALDALTPATEEASREVGQVDAPTEVDREDARSVIGENVGVSSSEPVEVAVQHPAMPADEAVTSGQSAPPPAVRRRHGGALPS